MKLELKENMYIRTKDGTIGKIIAIDLAKPRQEKYPNHPSKRWWRDKILISCYKGWITTQNIIKASYNIIDILENWDFVSTITGECAVIAGVYNDINSKKYLRLCNCIGEYYENDIKSVITHDQMEQMAYKVVE